MARRVNSKQVTITAMSVLCSSFPMPKPKRADNQERVREKYIFQKFVDAVAMTVQEIYSGPDSSADELLQFFLFILHINFIYDSGNAQPNGKVVFVRGSLRGSGNGQEVEQFIDAYALSPSLGRRSR